MASKKSSTVQNKQPNAKHEDNSATATQTAIDSEQETDKPLSGKKRFELPFLKMRYYITRRNVETKDPSKKWIPVALILSIFAVLASTALAAFIVTRKVGPSPEDRLELAKNYMEQEAYVDAAGVYSDLIQDGKLLAPSYLGLAETQIARGSVDAAVESLQKGLEETDGDISLLKRLEDIAPDVASLEVQKEQNSSSQSSMEKTEKTESSQPATSEENPPEEKNEITVTKGDLQTVEFIEEAAPAIPIEWKDPELEKMIRFAMEIPESTPILQSDVADIQTLKILGPTHAAVNETFESHITLSGYTIRGITYSQHGFISSLDDLVHFKKLTKLIIGFHSISDIDALASLPSLETVGLYFNEIESLEPLANLTELEYLYAYNNRIQSLAPLRTCKYLKHLWVQNNQVSDLSPVGSLTELRELYVGGNQITDVSPLASLASLEYLNAKENQITDISVVAQMPSLKAVSFVQNPVVDYKPADSIRRVNGEAKDS